jgi:hypothetical protein
MLTKLLENSMLYTGLFNSRSVGTGCMVTYALDENSFPRQLSLDLGIDETFMAQEKKNRIKRSVVFPKNIQVFNVPEFQRQVSRLFNPLNINIEFRLTRHNRLEMRWSFPHEAIQYNQNKPRCSSLISPEESSAFETLVLSFAGSSH